MAERDEVRASRRAVLCAVCVVPVVAGCGADPEAAPGPSGSASATGTPTGTPSPSGSPNGATARPTGGTTPSASATSAPGAAPASPSARAGGSAPTAATEPTPTATRDSPKPTPKPTADAPPPGALVKVSAVPVGGGVVLNGDDIVVTQPSSGTFRGFSDSCTHRGCDVGSVSGGNIVCPCHGSTFSVVDGSVTRGPATKPLSSRSVTVRSGWVCKA